MYSIMLSANRGSFTSSFPIWIPDIPFIPLIAIVKTSKTMLNNSGESGCPCLAPHLGMLSVFTIENNICCGFVVLWPLLHWGRFLLCPFLKSCLIYHKWVLAFVKGFFFIYWDYHMVFIFQFVNMVYHIDWFAYSEESKYPWDKTDLIMVYDLFNVLLNPSKNFD